MTTRIGRGLGRFQHSVELRLKERQPWIVQDGVWVYLPMEDAMAEAIL